MAIDPGLISLAGGLVSGLFGSKKPRYTEGQRIALDTARSLQRYGQEVPGSDPQEMALLAQLNSQLGAHQANARNNLYAAMPMGARTDQADMLRNIGAQEGQQRGNLNMQALFQFLQSRQLARLQAGQLAGGVGAPGEQGRPGIGPQIGQLVQLYAQQQAMKSGRGGGAPVAGQGARPMGTLGSVEMTGGGVGPMGMRFGSAPPPAPVAIGGMSAGGAAEPAAPPTPWPQAQLAMGGMTPRVPRYGGVAEAFQRMNWPQPQQSPAPALPSPWGETPWPRRF